MLASDIQSLSLQLSGAVWRLLFLTSYPFGNWIQAKKKAFYIKKRINDWKVCTHIRLLDMRASSQSFLKADYLLKFLFVLLPPLLTIGPNYCAAAGKGRNLCLLICARVLVQLLIRRHFGHFLPFSWSDPVFFSFVGDFFITFQTHFYHFLKFGSHDFCIRAVHSYATSDRNLVNQLPRWFSHLHLLCLDPFWTLSWPNNIFSFVRQFNFLTFDQSCARPPVLANLQMLFCYHDNR